MIKPTVGGAVLLTAGVTLVALLQLQPASATPAAGDRVEAGKPCRVQKRAPKDDVCIDRSVVKEDNKKLAPRPKDIAISPSRHMLVSLPRGEFHIYLGNAAVCNAGVDANGNPAGQKTIFQTHTAPSALLSMYSGEAQCTMKQGSMQTITVCQYDTLYANTTKSDCATVGGPSGTLSGSAPLRGTVGFGISVVRATKRGRPAMTINSSGGTTTVRLASGRRVLVRENYREILRLTGPARKRKLVPGTPFYLPVPYLIKVYNLQAPALTKNAPLGPAPAPLPVPNRKFILFESNRGDQGYQVYLMNPDGTGQKALTSPPHESFDPAWSPDGKQVVFESDRDSPGRSQLFLMNADGTNERPLITSSANERMPKWSPDGSKIAFEVRQEGQSQIYLVGPGGTKPTKLEAGPGQNSDPAWSPDGTRIVFKSDRDGKTHIFVVNLDGTGLTRLTDTAADDSSPAWSPDGRQIVFERDFAPGNAKLFLMNVDGTKQRRLTAAGQEELHPAWSPDGTRIVFAESHGRDTQIAIVNVDGGGQKELTSGHSQNLVPNW